MNSIAVEYAAKDPVADQRRLTQYVRRQIDEHLRSIHEIPVASWDLSVQITKCKMGKRLGSVALLIDGSVGGAPIACGIHVTDKTPPPSWNFHRPRLRRRSVGYLTSFLALPKRLAWPSELGRALGQPRINGQLQRAWSDCFTEIRVQLDAALKRPQSGLAKWWRAIWIGSLAAGLLSAAVCAALFFQRRGQITNVPRVLRECAVFGLGVSCVLINCGIALLPAQFFKAERAGLRLVRLFGVKSVAAIRVVALGLLIGSVALFLAPSAHWLFFK